MSVRVGGRGCRGVGVFVCLFLFLFVGLCVGLCVLLLEGLGVWL